MAAIESSLGIHPDTYIVDAYQGPAQVGLAEFDAAATPASKALGIADPYANIQAGISYMSAIQARLKKRGIANPTAGDVYAAYNQGVGDYMKLRNNPDATAASVVGLESVIQNIPLNIGAQADTITSAEFVVLIKSYPERAYNLNTNHALVPAS